MKRLNVILLAILALATVLRLFHLDAHSLWYDEAFAVLFAEKGLNAMLYGTLAPVQGGASDIHPLLYYTTLNVWMGIFGQSAFIVRLWSVIPGVLTVGMVYLVARDLFNQRTGYAAALITALMPFHIHYSQEARMYSLLALLLLTATYCYLKAVNLTPAGHVYATHLPLHSVERGSQSPSLRSGEGLGEGKWLWWLLFGICAGLAMYAQQLAAFYLVALGLLPLFTRRRAAFVGMALGVIVALVIYAPWLINLPAQLQKVNSYYWVQKPALAQIFVTLYLFLTNYGEIPPPGNLLGLAVAILILLLMGIFILFGGRLARHYRRKSAVTEPHLPHGLRLSLWLFAAPIALMWLVSQLQPVFLERGLITSAVMLYICLGWLLANPRTPVILRGLIGVALLVNVGIGLAYQYSLSTFPYSPLREVVAAVRAEQQAGDVIIHQNKLSALPAIFHGRDLTQRYLGDVPGSPQDTLALPTQEVLGLYADACIAQATANADRIWFVVYARAEAEYAASGNPDLQNTFAWLNAHYTLQDTRPFNDVKVYVYADRRGDTLNKCNLTP